MRISINGLRKQFGGARAASSDAPLPMLADGTQYGPVSAVWSHSFDRRTGIRTAAGEERREFFGRRQ